MHKVILEQIPQFMTPAKLIYLESQNIHIVVPHILIHEPFFFDISLLWTIAFLPAFSTCNMVYDKVVFVYVVFTFCT